MIKSVKDLLWMLFSIGLLYISLVRGDKYFIIFAIIFIMAFVVLFFLDKNSENEILDIVALLAANGHKEIDFNRVRELRKSKSEQDYVKFVNYYKRKGIIPFDTKFVNLS